MFKKVPLTTLLSSIVDNRGKTCPTSEVGIPLIATNCVKNTNIYPSHEKVRYVSQENYDNWFRAHPKPGDLIFVTKGSPGEVCLAPDPVGFCIAQDMVALRADETIVYPNYLFAALRAEQTQREILSLHVGTLIPHFKKGDFDKLLLPLPDWLSQKSIGDFYATISLKIENNRKMNQTLEEMARAIFKSWFVDFDPVHAKAAGNIPAHMDDETAALFPSSFDDNGLPTGWRMKSLGDIADLSWGDTNTTKKSYVEEGFDAYSASGKDGKLSYFDFERLGIVLSAIGANCGKTWLARGKWSCIKNTIRFWSLNELAPTIYLFHATGRSNFWPLRGSAQPFISQGDARSRSVLIPSNGEATHFESFVDKLYKKISDNEDENQTLVELRDTLLPKLMSGEIRVKDAEREVESAL